MRGFFLSSRSWRSGQSRGNWFLEVKFSLPVMCVSLVRGTKRPIVTGRGSVVVSSGTPPSLSNRCAWRDSLQVQDSGGSAASEYI